MLNIPKLKIKPLYKSTTTKTTVTTTHTPQNDNCDSDAALGITSTCTTLETFKKVLKKSTNMGLDTINNVILIDHVCVLLCCILNDKEHLPSYVKYIEEFDENILDLLGSYMTSNNEQVLSTLRDTLLEFIKKLTKTNKECSDAT